MRVWDPISERALRRLYGSIENKDLADLFTCDVAEIETAAEDFALRKNKAAPMFRGIVKMPRWTASEIDLLRKLYPKSKNVALARLLKRSARSVSNKAQRLGVSKGADHRTKTGRENVAMRADRVQR